MYDQCIELSRLNNWGRRWSLEVLLLVFTSLWIFVIDDEVDLVGCATLVRTEHDHVRRGVGELVSMQLLVVLQQLHVCTTALKAILKFDLVLHDESLALVVDLRGKLGGDGMVRSRVLYDKTFVS